MLMEFTGGHLLVLQPYQSFPSLMEMNANVLSESSEMSLVMPSTSGLTITSTMQQMIACGQQQNGIMATC
jgi:hypothetical protein